MVLISIILSFCMGVIQTLISPMILSFSDEIVPGRVLSISACGLLISSFVLAGISLKANFHKILSYALIVADIAMCSFGASQNLMIIIASGIIFFAMLPIANSVLDYMVRVNVENELLARTFAIISLISQAGYIIAYGAIGYVADNIMGGFLRAADWNISADAFGICISMAGTLLSLTAVYILYDRELGRL